MYLYLKFICISLNYSATDQLASQWRKFPNEEIEELLIKHLDFNRYIQIS